MGIELFPSNQPHRKVFRLPFAYTPAQLKIEQSPARFKIIRAGRKFGKTTYAQKKALDWLGPPNSVHWHIAPTYKQAKLISWNEFKRMIPAQALGKKPNDTDLVMTLKNGSQLYLMGSDDRDSLRGPAPSSVTFEEAAFHQKEAWYEVIRPNLMPRKAPALFIGTPKGFNWFKDLEDEAIRSIKAGENKWATFHYTVYDNPHISKEEIEDSHKDCDSEEVWRQEYLAEFESSVGRVFSAFSDQRHVRKVDVPVGNFDAYRAVDWGMRDNTACLWGFVRSGRLHIYREYLANNMSAPAQAEAIRNQTGNREKIVRTAISHDAAKEDAAMKGLTVMWHFKEAGITPLTPSSRDKKHSRAMIQELLHENRLVIDDTKCSKLRKQLQAYEWKDTTMEKTDDTAEDDAIDALHYLVEMLQFDLFLGKRVHVEKSMSEIYAEIAREKLQQINRPKVPMPSMFNKNEEFGSQFENTSAGYL